MSFAFIESTIAAGMMAMTGNPLLIGVIVLLFLGGIALVSSGRMDSKLFFIIPALILAMAFIPIIFLGIVLLAGVIIYIALIRLTEK